MPGKYIAKIHFIVNNIFYSKYIGSNYVAKLSQRISYQYKEADARQKQTDRSVHSFRFPFSWPY